jgi:hypothetical protein
LTVTAAVPLIAPVVALSVAVSPTAPVAVARPVGSIATRVSSSESQATDAVTSSIKPSSNMASAVNCCVPPMAMVAVAGVTVMLIRVAAVTVSRVVPPNAPTVAVMVSAQVATPRARPSAPALLSLLAIAPALELQLTVAVRS